MAVNYKQIFAIQEKNKQRWLKMDKTLRDVSGIYILTREQDGIRYAYIGQAKKMLTRLAQHLQGNEQHIDLSLKKWGLYGIDRPNGWKVDYVECFECDLDELEQQFIRDYANRGYQLRNKTIGGQGQGKVGINENKPSKGYRDGLKQGYENARKDVAKLFEKNLKVEINGKETKLKLRAFDKFQDFLKKN